MRRQIADSLEDKPFPPMPEDWQKRAFFEFGSIEEHMKYRPAVMQAYPAANFPILRTSTTYNTRFATRKALRTCW